MQIIRRCSGAPRTHPESFSDELSGLRYEHVIQGLLDHNPKFVCHGYGCTGEDDEDGCVARLRQVHDLVEAPPLSMKCMHVYLRTIRA